MTEVCALEPGPGPVKKKPLVSIVPASPEESKSRGAGIVLEYGFHRSRFGLCLAGMTPRGLGWLSLGEEGKEAAALAELRERWSGAQLREKPAETAGLMAEIFSSGDFQPQAPVSLLLLGTAFQMQVWRALLQIPAGKTVSYERLGERLGKPRACRAVGSAVGQNPIALLIPCHRVVQKNGGLGGFHWGVERKRALLAWERRPEAERLVQRLA